LIKSNIAIIFSSIYSLIKVGSEIVWLWVTIEPENKQILAVTVSKERNTLIVEKFISRIVKIHRKHPISTNEEPGIQWLVSF
jgi:transposase-like protein